MKNAHSSKAILERLPSYLKLLRALDEVNVKTTSSVQIASTLGFGEVQVRKDLGTISGKGKPRVGYVVKDLIGKVEACLLRIKSTDVVLVGVGKLGKALLGFDGFKEYGLKIAASFDVDKAKENEKANIYHLSKLGQFINEHEIKLGIITVPEFAAQEVCDTMVSNGVTAILNFAPVKLVTPEGVVVRNENLASSLAMLAGKIS